MRWALLGLLLIASEDEAAAPKLSMTPAKVCLEVDGYGAFTLRHDSVLTKDEKLMLYVEPIGHTFEEREGEYRLHLSQDVQVRRKADGRLLGEKKEIVDYKATSKEPPLYVYLMTEISLKTLPPGEYLLTLALRDRIDGGPAAEQVVPFTVTADPPAPSGPDERPQVSPTTPRW